MKRVIIFVIALSFIDLTLAANHTEKPKCSELHHEYAEAGDKVYEEFNKAVKLVLETEQPDLEVALQNYNASLKEFLRVGNETCKNGTARQRNFDIYFNITKYALSNGPILKDLHNNHVFTCMNNNKKAIESSIKRCVSKVNTTENATEHTLYYNIYTKSSLHFSYTACAKNSIKKNCTQTVLVQYCGNNKTDAQLANLTGSLFDYTKKYCSFNSTVIPSKSASVNITGLMSITLFAVILAYIMK